MLRSSAGKTGHSLRASVTSAHVTRATRMRSLAKEQLPLLDARTRDRLWQQEKRLRLQRMQERHKREREALEVRLFPILATAMCIVCIVFIVRYLVLCVVCAMCMYYLVYSLR